MDSKIRIEVPTGIYRTAPLLKQLLAEAQLPQLSKEVYYLPTRVTNTGIPTY
jgi:hypothetical protein